MARISNDELVARVLAATNGGRIDWQATGAEDQYTASFGGKFTLVVDRSYSQSGAKYYLDVKDAEGELVVKVRGGENDDIPTLFELARRFALKIDEKLTDLFTEIDKLSQ